MPFERERLGHHAHGQDATFARHAGDDGCSPRAGSAAHACGDEDHVRTIKMAREFVARFFRGGAADLGLRPRAQPLRQVGAKLDAAVGAAVGKLLGIGVGDDEFHALQLRMDHVVHRIRTTAANPDHCDAGREIGMILLRDGQVEGHAWLPMDWGRRAGILTAKVQ